MDRWLQLMDREGIPAALSHSAFLLVLFLWHIFSPSKDIFVLAPSLAAVSAVVRLKNVAPRAVGGVPPPPISPISSSLWYS